MVRRDLGGFRGGVPYLTYPSLKKRWYGWTHRHQAA